MTNQKNNRRKSSRKEKGHEILGGKSLLSTQENTNETFCRQMFIAALFITRNKSSSTTECITLTYPHMHHREDSIS